MWRTHTHTHIHAPLSCCLMDEVRLEAPVWLLFSLRGDLKFALLWLKTLWAASPETTPETTETQLNQGNSSFHFLSHTQAQVSVLPVMMGVRWAPVWAETVLTSGCWTLGWMETWSEVKPLAEPRGVEHSFSSAAPPAGQIQKTSCHFSESQTEGKEKISRILRGCNWPPGWRETSRPLSLKPSGATCTHTNTINESYY